MKSFTKSLLISSFLGAMLAAPAAGAFAQESDTSNQPTPPKPLESLSYKDINANIRDAAADPANPAAAQAQENAPKAEPANLTVVDGVSLGQLDTLYDPVVITPEISENTSARTNAARAVLEQTHQTVIPTADAQHTAGAQQSLPGESAIEAAVEEISELNEIKPGEPLTLRQALLIADEKNLDLAAARVQIDMANAKLKQAWALLMPNISGTISYAHVYNNAQSAGMADALKGATGPAYESLGNLAGGLGEAAAAAGAVSPEIGGMLGQLAQKVGEPLQKMAANQPKGPTTNSIDSVNFGLTVGLSIINVAGWFQLRMADEATDITALGIEEGRQQLLAGVAQAYMAALLCGEVVKVQRVQLKSALDQLSLAQGRFDRGADVKLSVIQAQFGVEKQRQALIDAIWSYETARDALANLLSYDGLPVPQPSHIKAVDITTDEALEQEALKNNRTLKINRMTQHVNELNLNSAIASFFPTLSGAWQFGYNLHTPGSGIPSSPTWTLAISANIPLFDYSKFGALDEREASILETQLKMDSTVAATKTAVRKAKREYFSSVFNVDNAKRQVELAREALRLTEAAYQNGASTFIDVSDARNNVAAASISYITAAIQAELSMISLISTLGRDIMEVVYK